MNPLPIVALHHIARTTLDVDASVAFYRDVLGFRPIQRPNFSFRGAWLFNYGFQIHIIEHGLPGAAGGAIDTRADHLALAVKDVAAMDAVEKNLRERGMPYERQVNAGGIPQIFFHDPDGHHVEIGVYPVTPPFVDEGKRG
jgi:catechol 2,3-dioxygenase-like lactoylglutathione lyase family enzyme